MVEAERPHFGCQTHLKRSNRDNPTSSQKWGCDYAATTMYSPSMIAASAIYDAI
jgi:hypothetical protein